MWNLIVSVPDHCLSFYFGTNSILITDKYAYLGITLDECLDFTITAKAVAQSASRALGFLIAKYK